MSAEDFESLPIAWPGTEEQRRIADFLDDRVARIDQIIAARGGQARLRAESAVTQVQSLYDHWAEQHGTIRLGRVLAALEQGWSPQAEAVEAGPDEWGVMRAGCVNDGVFRESDNKKLPDDLEPQRHYEIRAGDLLMSRASGSLEKIGSAAVVPHGVRRHLLICDKVYRLTPTEGWESSFIAPMLHSHVNREAIRLGVSGAEGMANNLPSGVVRGLRMPNLPHKKQSRSVRTIEELNSETRSAIAALTGSARLLTEYRQSLITAAVTGELDVTTAGSGVPG